MLETHHFMKLAHIRLDESGFVYMWRNDTSHEAPGRFEHLKEFVNTTDECKSLQ